MSDPSESPLQSEIKRQDEALRKLQGELAEIGVYFDGEGEPYNKNAGDLAARVGIAERTIAAYQTPAFMPITTVPSSLGEDQERDDRWQELKDFFNDPDPEERPNDLMLMDEVKLYERMAALEAAHTKEIMRHGVTLFELKESREQNAKLSAAIEAWQAECVAQRAYSERLQSITKWSTTDMAIALQPDREVNNG